MSDNKIDTIAEIDKPINKKSFDLEREILIIKKRYAYLPKLCLGITLLFIILGVVGVMQMSMAAFAAVGLSSDIYIIVTWSKFFDISILGLRQGNKFDERLSALTKAEASINKISEFVSEKFPQYIEEFKKKILPEIQEKIHKVLSNGTGDLEKGLFEFIDKRVGELFGTAEVVDEKAMILTSQPTERLGEQILSEGMEADAGEVIK